MSEIFSAQLLAVSTAALVFATVLAVIFAGLAFRQQYKELKESREQRKREQASRVFYAFFPNKNDETNLPIHIDVDIVNKSDYPIYDVRLWWCFHEIVLTLTTELGMILPGETSKASGKVDHDMYENLNFTLEFTDSAGVRWLRRGNELSEHTTENNQP